MTTNLRMTILNTSRCWKCCLKEGRKGGEHAFDYNVGRLNSRRDFSTSSCFRSKDVVNFIYERSKISDEERMQLFTSANSVNYYNLYETSPFDTVITGRSLGYVIENDLIFENVNFSLKPGGAILLQGPNGSGKSTLLNMIMGDVKPSVGFLAMNGIPVSQGIRSEIRSELAMYIHSELMGMHPRLTVEENLAYYDAHMLGAAVSGGKF